MTCVTRNATNYLITQKLPVGMRWLGLRVVHPALSAQDIAALTASIVVKAFQKNWENDKVAAMFAQAVFDGDGVPGPNNRDQIPGTEFAIDFKYTGLDMPVGDKWAQIPRLQVTAYRPITLASGLQYYPLPSEEKDQCRGVLELTMEHGTVLITAHKGWIGSNEIVEYLRKQFEAAVSNKGGDGE